MKKNSLACLCVLCIIGTLFNVAHAQTKIGLKAGVSFSNIREKDEAGQKSSTQFMPGAQVGLTVDIPLSGNIYLQPAFVYADRGFKQAKGGFYGTADGVEVDVSYIEVPILLLYKPKIGKSNLLLGAGGYLAYGTGGKWKSATDPLIGDIRLRNYGYVIFKNDGRDGEFESYLYGKPLDYGVNLLVGYELFKQFSLQFNGQFGLANLQPHYGDIKPKGELKNIAFGISLGYKFH